MREVRGRWVSGRRKEGRRLREVRATEGGVHEVNTRGQGGGALVY